MTVWNEEKVRFMREAAEYGGFYDTLAARAAEYIGAEDTVCDAGCGLGYLSLALLGRCAHVTAIDRSGEALGALRERAGQEPHLTVLEGDVFAMPAAARFDDMVFCFFASVGEALSTARAHCNKRAVLIRKDWELRRFCLSQEPVLSTSFRRVLEELDRLGIPYMSESFMLDMGQPFRSLEAAAAFFRLYNGGEAAPEAAILPQLKSTGDKTFPYYLPAERSVGIAVLEIEDIPDKFADTEGKR